MKKEIENTFEAHVQAVFNTTSGRALFIQMAIMTDSFINSLVATAKLRTQTGCENPNVYFNAQRDLAEKFFNALTHEQFANLRAGVMATLFPSKPTPKKEQENVRK